MTELPIIVAGGGIGGLFAAVAIARSGRPVALLERAAEFGPIGYGIQLGPNALHTFERLGLLDEVLSHCSLLDEGLLSDATDGSTLARLPMGRAMVERFGQPYAVIHRADLHHVLLDACAALPGVSLRTDFEVVCFDDRGDRVVVHAKGGDSLQGSLLVAADGIWSAIRQQLFPEVGLPLTSRYAAFRCVCPIAQVDPGLARNVVNLRCGTNFHMIHYPLRGGTLFNLVAATRVPDGVAMDDRGGVVAHFDEVFDGACEEVRALVPLVDRSRFWAISNLQPLREWVRGRVVLIGDAAHAMVQAMAQGACQAVEDGYVLAKHLAAADDPAQAALAYQAERHIRATDTQYRSLFMWELIHATGGWRDLRRAKLEKMTPADVLAGLDWLYSAAPGSELAGELGPSERHATGDHATERYVRAAGLPDPAAASALHG